MRFETLFEVKEEDEKIPWLGAAVTTAGVGGMTLGEVRLSASPEVWREEGWVVVGCGRVGVKGGVEELAVCCCC